MISDTHLDGGEAAGAKPKSFTRYLPHIARVLMGLLFFVFGLNGFLNFFPPPKTGMPEFSCSLLEARQGRSLWRWSFIWRGRIRRRTGHCSPHGQHRASNKS